MYVSVGICPVNGAHLFVLIRQFLTAGLRNRKLWIKVMDSDVGKDDCLGKSFVDMEDFKPTSTPKGIDVRVDNNLIKRDAVMWLKISYVE
jgi:hypothetical protein